MSSRADLADWPRLKPLVIEALDRPSEQRGEFLDSACAGDAALRSSVQRFLDAYDRGASALQPPSSIQARDPLIGQRIGHYTILRLIGCGGMGAVYRARQDQPNRIVALKLMRTGMASRSAQRRFEHESQLLARLHHPGIAQVYEAGTYRPDPPHPLGPIPFIAMEFVPDGVTITRFAQMKALDVRLRLKLFADVCDAVHHGHQNGVIHRDLKPANILVDSAGQPKVIDFGVARLIDADSAKMTLVTTADQIIGTLQYLAPERLGPEHAGEADSRVERIPAVDIRSDIYALGVTLFELLADRTPYALEGVALPEAMRMIRESQPPSLGGIDRALRGDVDNIVRKSMEKERERRYQSTAELAADIRRHLNDEPIIAHPPSATYHIRAFARRNKALVSGVAAVFFILVAAIIGVSAALSHSMRMEQHAIAQRDRARKIVGFLKSVLVSADPLLAEGPTSSFTDLDPFADVSAAGPSIVRSSAGRTNSAAELMAQAGTLLNVSFEDEPEVKAEVADTLGVTLAGMGRGGEAMPLLRDALDIRRRVLGEDHPDTINSCLHLGSILTGGNSKPEGERLLRNAIDSLTRLNGPADQKTLAASLVLAWNLSDQGRPEEAISLTRRNLAIAEQHFGRDHPVTLAQVKRLSELASPEESMALAKRAVDGLSAAFGADSIPAADAMTSLGAMLRQRGLFEEAERMITAALASYRARFGPDTLRTLDHERQLFEILRREGRFADAAEVVRANLARVRNAYEPEHHLILRLEDRLARALIEQGGHLDEAEALSRHAADVSLRNWGEHDVLVVLYRNTYAAALRQLGKPQDAEREIRPSLSQPVDDIALLAVEDTLAQCLIDQNRLDEAEQLLQRAHRHAITLDDPYEPRYIELLNATVRLYETWGKPIEAEPYRVKLASLQASAASHALPRD